MRYFWKMYAGVLVVAAVSAIAGVLSSDQLSFWWSFSPVPIAVFLVTFLLCLVPIFGLIAFSWGKKFGFRGMWRVVFWIMVILWPLEVFQRVEEATRGGASCSGSWCPLMQILVVAIGLPLTVGLYLYAYRSDEIWNAGSSR